MQPAARTAAAIELLSEVELTGKPVDIVAKGFFRNRRYAGSGDRRFIIGLVYDSFRNRGQAFHEIASSGLEPTDRRLILAALKSFGDDASTYFDDSEHGPGALSTEEQALFGSEAEDDVGGIWPVWMQAAIERCFGEDASEEMLALNDRAQTAIRVNTALEARDRFVARLAAGGIEAVPALLSPMGVRLPLDISANALADFSAAKFEIQDEGSQIAALLADAQPGHQVIDFCAGGGGKTLALAAAMENKGQIHALDVDRQRLQEVARRTKIAKVHNVQTKLLEGDAVPSELVGIGDRVLVDAPCTGSGTWRRHPEGKWLIKEDAPAKAANLQRQILASAAQCAKPGGRLIYVTCSFFPAENEEVVADFLRQQPEFTLSDMKPLWQEVMGKGIPENILAGPDGGAILLSPWRTKTDAFYVAVMERSNA